MIMMRNNQQQPAFDDALRRALAAIAPEHRGLVLDIARELGARHPVPAPALRLVR